MIASNGSTLYVGYNPSGNGTYNLSAGSLAPTTEYVGYSGSGTFNQSGGTNNVGNGSGTIFVGNRTANNAYNLSGTGTLLAGSEYIGSGSGKGTFTQSGGTNNLGSNGNLYLGYFGSTGGTYSLSGPSTLVANIEYVGNSGSAGLIQNGGLNTLNFLSIGVTGRYQFSGGTLQLSALSNQGVLDAAGGTGTMNFTGNGIIDISAANVLNSGSMSLSVGPSFLLLVPANFNPATAFGSYSNQGETHYAGTPLTVLSGQSFSGAFSLADPLICQGIISSVPGSVINLSGGVNVAGTGSVSIGNGTISMKGSPSGIT